MSCLTRAATLSFATATMRFTVRSVAVVAPRSSTGGEMNIYVDGKFAKSIYLYGSTYQPRRVVFSTSRTSSGTHTIAVVKKPASRGCCVGIGGSAAFPLQPEKRAPLLS